MMSLWHGQGIVALGDVSTKSDWKRHGLSLVLDRTNGGNGRGWMGMAGDGCGEAGHLHGTLAEDHKKAKLGRNPLLVTRSEWSRGQGQEAANARKGS